MYTSEKSLDRRPVYFHAADVSASDSTDSRDACMRPSASVDTYRHTHRFRQICELPNELIYNIVKYLKDDDLCNLYIVNNLFNIIIDCDLEK